MSDWDWWVRCEQDWLGEVGWWDGGGECRNGMEEAISTFLVPHGWIWIVHTRKSPFRVDCGWIVHTKSRGMNPPFCIEAKSIISLPRPAPRPPSPPGGKAQLYKVFPPPLHQQYILRHGSLAYPTTRLPNKGRPSTKLTGPYPCRPPPHPHAFPRSLITQTHHDPLKAKNDKKRPPTRHPMHASRP